ncbi:thioredoxin reductase [Entomortierella beljakovae]|nr:thioredoxin reductase [Entomortierella beljakovae]
MGESIKAMVERLIRENRIMLFAKSYCPHCKNAKRLFTEDGLKFKTFEIDLEDNGPEVQDYLLKKSGQRTVPNIFVNTKHLGGNTDLIAAREDGRLEKMLKLRGEL